MRAFVFLLVFALPLGGMALDALARGLSVRDALGLAVVAFVLANLASVAAGPRIEEPE